MNWLKCSEKRGIKKRYCYSRQNKRNTWKGVKTIIKYEEPHSRNLQKSEKSHVRTTLDFFGLEKKNFTLSTEKKNESFLKLSDPGFWEVIFLSRSLCYWIPLVFTDKLKQVKKQALKIKSDQEPIIWSDSLYRKANIKYAMLRKESSRILYTRYQIGHESSHKQHGFFLSVIPSIQGHFFHRTAGILYTNRSRVCIGLTV